MEMFIQNPASTLMLVTWITLCLVALIARAIQVERQTRVLANELYRPFDSK